MQRFRHGGRILVDQLAVQGCDTVFCVPGESYLAALDGLFDHPSIRTVVSRHEGAAAMMADAHGKLTGRPGVWFVTRAPGGGQRVRGSACRAPGLDADDPVHRSGRPGRPRPRSLPGSRLPSLPRAYDEVGGADRPHRAHPGVPESRLARRDGGPAGAGGARSARRHALGERRDRGRPACGGGLTQSDGRGHAPPRPDVAREHPAPARGGRAGMERRDGGGGRRLRRAPGAAGHGIASLPGLHRQPPLLLCRRPGTRHQSGPCAAGSGLRPPHLPGRPARRPDHARLPPRRHPQPEPASRAHPCEQRRAGPCLPAGIRRQRFECVVRGATFRDRPMSTPNPGVRGRRRRAPTTSAGRNRSRRPVR